jgi:hypothetical protein
MSFLSGLHNFVPPGGRGMHIRFVRKVHEIVDQQLKIAFHVIRAALENPLGVRTPGHLRDLAFVGEFGISDPHPHNTMPFRHWISANFCFPMNTGLPWHAHAFPAGIKFQDVILAHDMVAL